MIYSEDERALIWLCACTGLDRRVCAALLRAAPSPVILFRDFEKFFEEVVKTTEIGVYKKGISSREGEIEDFLAALDKKGYFAVTVLSEDYPEALKAADPPIVLYGVGRRELLKERKFCIVGSRLTPPWAAKRGQALSERLSGRFAIVTGLAEGGDLAAIRGALPSGKLICVLPHGLDECYPAAHASYKEEIRKKGLLLSEYLPAEKTKKYNFAARNRILAGLSEGVLVLSAGKRSGALMTAGYAAEFGRDVFAFPYSLGTAQGEGCNELIKHGAYLCTGEEDVFECYGMAPQSKPQVPLSEEEARVLDVLQDGEEQHAAIIAERAGLQIYEITAVLSALELKGLAVKLGGNRYQALK